MILVEEKKKLETQIRKKIVCGSPTVGCLKLEELDTFQQKGRTWPKSVIYLHRKKEGEYSYIVKKTFSESIKSFPTYKKCIIGVQKKN